MAETRDRLIVSTTTVLRFAPHIVFRFDNTRRRWIIMAPERLMLPDEQAVAILQLIDGKIGFYGEWIATGIRPPELPVARVAATPKKSQRKSIKSRAAKA